MMNIEFKELILKAQKIKLAVFDIDGVFTNGNLYINSKGEETKTFNVQDGLGIVLLLKTGIEVAVISGLPSKAVEHRMKNLGVKHVFLGHSYKSGIYKNLCSNLGLSFDEVAYMGDDLPDLPLIQCSGLGVTVANAVPLIKNNADLQTKAAGGQGAVREFCDWLMMAQGSFDRILLEYQASPESF